MCYRIAVLEPSDYDFDLPDELIARYPAAERDASRLLSVSRESGALSNSLFADLPTCLRAGDCLVLNDSKVLPARLYGKVGEARVELLLVRRLSEKPNAWVALGRPGKKLKINSTIVFDDGSLAIVREKEAQQLVLHFDTPENFVGWLDSYGNVPLPPYLHRSAEPKDRERYQTVYAKNPGSVAAPTAGLHFTPELLQLLESQGVRTARLTLHVGYGTFAPLVRGATTLHQESYSIPEASLEILKQTRSSRGRVIAVGTTSTRVLESYGMSGETSGETNIFIQPGHRFRWTDGLITNFHLPQSSLLVLVASFLGKEKTLAAYRHAIAAGYRFYSYGDAMLIL
ncbi:MAG: tRNA preQ1(34) S-adenosylmethionine ribosyltransferase-isomerase QueA [Bdellovibrionales bacterium]|nr:tRNA preQ1(34) S-adenosylmethionine ribosyltransferase-isomerase QueA [Bdellovibrionales bacterium]